MSEQQRTGTRAGRPSQQSRRRGRGSADEQSAGVGRQDGRNVRTCTVDTKVAQLEEAVCNADIQKHELRRKLSDTLLECTRLVDEVQSLKQQLIDSKVLARKYRSVARKLETNEELTSTRAELEVKKQEVDEAWNQCRATEREKRRQDSVAHQNIRQLKDSLLSTAAEQERKDQIHTKLISDLRAKLNEANIVNEELRRGEERRGVLFSESQAARSTPAEHQRDHRLRQSLTRIRWIRRIRFTRSLFQTYEPS